jgi:hypothetical protein
MSILSKYKRWNPLFVVDESNRWDFTLFPNSINESSIENNKCVDIDFSQN